MKTVFLLNPKAGKGKGLDRIKEEVDRTAERMGCDAGIYLTKSVGDAEKFARLAAEEAEKNGEEIRLIACGGDGTLNEVINGAAGFGCASVGVMPVGTGNDFVRNFSGAGDHMSVEAQIRGRVQKCDLIKYQGVIDGQERTRYCANMFNIGFDCNVVDLTAKVKEYPLLKGSLAYLVSVLAILVKKKGALLKVEIDGETVQDGPVLLTAVANGAFCGGGVKGLPKADLTDGLMDASIIYNVSRTEFLKKFPYYAKGTHLDLPNVDKIVYYRQCREVAITPLNGMMRLCVDGEISDAGQIHMEIVPEAARIVVPAVLTEQQQ